MKTTNKQGITPSIYSHHHTQDLTCDCRNCGVEFTQYHRGHIYCDLKCKCEDRGIPYGPQTCGGCGCTDDTQIKSRGYRCTTCKALSLNPDRTDVTPRKP